MPSNPEPSFTTCACGVLILTHVWVSATKDTEAHWRTLPEPVTPALGLPHRCPEETPDALTA
jgi:hypothetical protein